MQTLTCTSLIIYCHRFVIPVVADKVKSVPDEDLILINTDRRKRIKMKGERKHVLVTIAYLILITKISDQITSRLLSHYLTLSCILLPDELVFVPH